MLASLLFAVNLALPQVAGADTVEVNRILAEALGEHFHTFRGPAPRLSNEEIGQLLGWVCDADAGETCLPDIDFNFVCRVRGGCPGVRDPIYDEIYRAGLDAPSSGYVIGHAVYGLVKAGRHLDAASVLDRCAALAWWCRANEVFLYHDAGRPEVASLAMERMRAEAEVSQLCQVLDATWLLGRFSQKTHLTAALPEFRKAWEDTSCQRRVAASDTVLWLADPLFVVEGNDRAAALVANSLRVIATRDLRNARSRTIEAHDVVRKARWIRRGPPDSFEHLRRPPRGAVFQSMWTSRKAARYHFVPDFEGEGFSKPSWRLMAELDDEGYTPPYAPFYELPLQIARFRASADTMQRVAAAGLVTGSEIEAAAESGYLVFTDAPESFPLQLEAPFREGRAVYLAEAETKAHAVSFEVLTSSGIGWHREWVEPLSTQGPGLSDVLLYRPTGMSEPDSLLAAAALMHGTTSLEPEELGLYWELYDVSAETPVEFSLEARKADGGGLISSLRRLLPGGGADEGSGQLAWTEPSTGPVHPRAITLDLRNLDEGEYDLVLRARWDGGEVESTRRIEVR